MSTPMWAYHHLRLKDFVLVDTETTGLRGDAEIVQVTLVNAWGRIAFSSLVQPTLPIDEAGDAFRFHGVCREQAAQAPRFDHVYRHLSGWMSGRKVIAYNADFDRRIISQVCALAGKPQIVSEWECAMLYYSDHVKEPGQYGSPKWWKLKEACEAMGVKDRGWHDATSDCLATYDLMVALAALHKPEHE